jgi:hypothetical protein
MKRAEVVAVNQLRNENVRKAERLWRMQTLKNGNDFDIFSFFRLSIYRSKAK